MSVDGVDPEGFSSETESNSVDDGGEEKWNGTGGGEEVDPLPSSGQHVKVPTGHELREMKEASELYKSSAFKLQVSMRRSLSTEAPYRIGIDRLVDTKRSSGVWSSWPRIIPSNTPRDNFVNSSSSSPTPTECISVSTQGRSDYSVRPTSAHRGN